MESVTEATTHRRRIWIIPAILIVAYAGIQAVAFAVLPERDADGSVLRGGRVDVATLQTGDCFDWTTDIESGSIRQVDLQPCHLPHEATHLGEALFPAASTTPWPGIDTIDSYALGACTPLLPDDMDVVHIMPTEETWNSGDRTIVCIAVAG